MRFGFCQGYEHYALIALTGYDYFEPSFSRVLLPEVPESEIMPTLLETARAQPIKVEAFQSFLPPDLKVVGPEIDPNRQRRYLEAGFPRAAALGGEIVVFGSGGARAVPDGFARDEAVRQVIAFLKLAGPIADAHGMTIVIEPLCTADTNFINSVAEGMEIVRAVGHPAVQQLSDLFHVDAGGQSYDETRAAGAALKHVHVAGAEDRRTPILADVDYLARFFAVLKSMDYSGRITVEAHAKQVEQDAPIALEACRKAWDLA